jgi:hypothetical protein
MFNVAATKSSAANRSHPLLALLAIALMHSVPGKLAAATSLSLHIVGDGPTTLVFEAGLGDTLEVWRAVHRGSMRAHSVVYARWLRLG